MLLRPRQSEFLDKTLDALSQNDNTLGIAPTGAGKTILFSHLLGQLLARNAATKALVVAHRDEITEQNAEKFQTINPDISTSLFYAAVKDWSGRAVFGNIQTLSREGNIEEIPRLDFLVIDEAHRTTADTYQAIIAKVRGISKNCKIIGMTATPIRNDGVGLRKTYSNVSDQIHISELVNSGHLVPSRTFVIDVAQQHLEKVRKVAGEFDMSQVAEILNERPINEAVVENWKDKCADRKTVIFCSTIEHAEDVHRAFITAGVKAEIVTGNLSKAERSGALKRYYSGKTKVIVNVAVLTEGWDHPPTSCIVLLRQSSAKGTMIQMVGRGLRTVDTRDFPGEIKRDCIVLDFGVSSILHGTLEQDVDLDGKVGDYADLPSIECPSCRAEIPISSRECPICGSGLGSRGRNGHIEDRSLTHVEMVEINLLSRSHFQWVDLFVDGLSFYAGGFNAWSGVFCIGEDWIAVGGTEKDGVQLLAKGDRIQGFATADDWLNEHETSDTAHKSQSWQYEEPTHRQLVALPKKFRLDFNLTRYRASALIGFNKNKSDIRNLVDNLGA